MAPLAAFEVPFPPSGPPVGYTLEGRDKPDWVDDPHFMTKQSTNTMGAWAVKKRDTLLGQIRCVVCGSPYVRECAAIIKGEGPNFWLNLAKRHWIPTPSESDPPFYDNPCNRLSMCSKHRMMFEGYAFFIRFVPEAQKFVFVTFYHYPGDFDLAPYHGKAIAIDVDDPHAPLPSLFILHEMRTRGFNPFVPTEPDINIDDIAWQDWVYSSGVLDESSGSFRR